MSNRMTATQKTEALQNGLKYFNLDEKYFVHYTAPKFVIASKNEHGGINTHSSFMTYEEFNGFLKGYDAAKNNKL